MTTVTVISPVYNEGKGIAIFVEEVARVFSKLEYDLTIILVDDGSKDTSWSDLQKIIPEKFRIQGIRLAKNFGKESAIAAGLSLADSDVVITIDCDLQHPPELMSKMLELWEEGAEIVSAVKEKRQQESCLDRLAAASFYKIFHWITENDIGGTSDFILLDRKVADALKSLPEKLFFYRGVVQWLGFKQVSVSFVPKNREIGKSGWSFWKKLHLAIDSLTGFSAKPLVFIWFMTFLFVLFSLVVGGDAVISKIIGKSVSGFSTLILVILITGVAVLSCLCVLSAYIRQIFYEVKSRPRFLISQKIDLGGGEDSKNRKARK
ncbi:glycosyltransferase family 2 protein [Bartonella apis]|uniref:Glycosyltransferase involved in cell wall bisynthesis n=1 Tax=Bartonella apis TaxID=1686310 RepID=A0A1R0F7G3_9HYPH|nr:glycosyltransferase family 2 protein [Bartonella apis]MCT6823677.1 glycosyltransferase family 2 protein [Bartonella apis]MCT6886066.1 glycosyltransferase family 2 protein [Bartonella apis]OLY42879.1 Glycosyltransferase involved in cell wall bisynthesis [Bartonella apis]